MDTVILIAQIVIALGIANVWLVRASKSTAYRGGGAQDMKEEFAVYGLPESFMRLIGAAKLLLAAALIAGIWWPLVTRPAALGMAALMLGAIAMHLKVKDPLLKSLPALAMLALAVFVAVGS